MSSRHRRGLLKDLDGLTVTLHDNADVAAFLLFHAEYLEKKHKLGKKLMRLNTFKEVNLPLLEEERNSIRNNWILKEDMEWVKNCPLPPGEVFKRL